MSKIRFCLVKIKMALIISFAELDFVFVMALYEHVYDLHVLESKVSMMPG